MKDEFNSFLSSYDEIYNLRNLVKYHNRAVNRCELMLVEIR
jgi:hypothetical protein